MNIKSCPVKIKAAGENEGTEQGQFEAIVATWDVDSVNDQIIKGAFAESLQQWEASGDPIPVYWSHRMDDPDYNIGVVLTAEETDEGLRVVGQLDLDNPKAAQVYKLLKGRRVTQFSFAYDVEDYAIVKNEGEDSVWELRRLKLYEVGPTPIGANQATELLDVKAGPVADAAVMRLAQIKQLAEDLMATKTSPAPVSEASTTSDAEKATTEPTEPTGAPASPEAKATQPAGPGPADAHILVDLAALRAEVSLPD